MNNPLGITGIACAEFSAPTFQGLDRIEKLLGALGFSKTKRHKSFDIDYFSQGRIEFLLSRDTQTFAQGFAQAHGPCISSLGFLVKDPGQALSEAIRRGAKMYTGMGPFDEAPAIYGIGGSLIYFLEETGSWRKVYRPHPNPSAVASRGFYAIDHLTNNVEKGTLEKWRDFYMKIFGFTEVRTFDIRGEQTGLTSYALRSPCGTFCIPINEGSEEKSQIEEYLREYQGPGIQHLALLSDDLLGSLKGLNEAGVQTLDIDDDYYSTVFERVNGVTESHDEIQRLKVLVDGDDEGYLLQIFTQNVVGPIFFEMIQRKNHQSFGEGNFSALFRSIERDQERRGVLS